jgi:SRSO17 transposase
VASCCENLTSHFQSFRECFRSKTRSTAEQAEQYLRGLFQSPRANLEQMSETVAETEYYSLHHMLSDAAWDFENVRRETARQADEWIGGPETGLLLDESGVQKKGDHSAGVARQYNGRLGKVENSQVGVYAALARGSQAAIIDFELFLPERWVEDAKRCQEAGIPESARVFRTKYLSRNKLYKFKPMAGWCSSIHHETRSVLCELYRVHHQSRVCLSRRCWYPSPPQFLGLLVWWWQQSN